MHVPTIRLSRASLGVFLAVPAALLLSGCGRLSGVFANSKIGGDETDTLVLGDSLSTGVFTSSQFQLDYGGIVSAALAGHRDDPPELADFGSQVPTILRKPTEEVSMFGSAGPEAAMALLKVIEWPELSWEAQLAKSRGEDPSAVTIIARNGAQATKASDEVDTWKAAIIGDHATLPKQVYVFFSGDDLCRGLGDNTPVTDPGQFGDQIAAGLRHLADVGEENAAGTNVYLIEHLNVLQLAQNSTLLAQKSITIADDKGRRTLSCTSFLAGWERGDVATTSPNQLVKFSYNPMSQCGNLLAHAAGLDASKATTPLATLAATQAAYRAQLPVVASALNSDPRITNKGMKVRVINGMDSLVEAPEDVASDCFHLSDVGQRKLAQAVAAHL